ncbi:MAG: hypothetical protein ABSG81_11955 [Acidimicrobiales bacterium]|jgi:hypothetical protein
MVDHSTAADGTRIRTLESEVCALEQRLEQREALLKDLNRRLLQLERGENGMAGMERAGFGDVAQENQVLLEQLESLRNTKLFRWSAPARDVYAKLRRFL